MARQDIVISISGVAKVSIRILNLSFLSFKIYLNPPYWTYNSWIFLVCYFTLGYWISREEITSKYFEMIYCANFAIYFFIIQKYLLISFSPCTYFEYIHKTLHGIIIYVPMNSNWIFLTYINLLMTRMQFLYKLLQNYH